MMRAQGRSGRNGRADRNKKTRNEMARKKIDVPTSAPSVVVACQPEPTGVDAIR